MFLHSVTVQTNAPLLKSLSLEVLIQDVDDELLHKAKELSRSSAQVECMFRPAREIMEEGTLVVIAKIVKRTKVWGVTEETTVKIDFPYDDLLDSLDSDKLMTHEANEFAFSMRMSKEQEPLKDLLSASQEATSRLKSLLDRLGRARRPTQVVLSAAIAVAELHPAAKAVFGFVDLAHKHLQEQSDCDDAVKDMADDMQALFEHIEEVQAVSSLSVLLKTIERAKRLFEDAVEFIVAYCCETPTSRALRAAVTSTEKDKLKALQKRISIFKEQFDRGVATETLLEVKLGNRRNTQQIAAGQVVPVFKVPLRNKPPLLRGREDDLERIVKMLTVSEAAYIPILGDGGMGKTTLALWVLHDPRVEARFFGRRYFVECDTVSSASALLSELANVLRVPLEERDATSLLDTIIERLGESPTVLCLDSLETPWELSESRREVEDVLCSIATLSELSIIITIRGTQCPAELDIRWSHVLDPLSPLGIEDAKAVFEKSSRRPVDELAENLIREADGVPLALTLLGTLAQTSGGESTGTLWDRWNSEGSAVIENGGYDRSSSLDLSISLSVFGPRMRDNPDAADILAIIALLPDGLLTSGQIFDGLQSRLSTPRSLGTALTTLRRVALVQEVTADVNRDAKRLRLLSPVRNWCNSNLKPPGHILDAIVETYIEFIDAHADYADTNSYAAFTPEAVNCGAILLQGYQEGRHQEGLARATLLYTEWMQYLNDFSTELPALVLGHERDTGLRAWAHRCIGLAHDSCDRLDEAEESLQFSLELHEDAGDKVEQGIDQRWMARVYLHQGSLEKAEAAIETAIGVHRGVSIFEEMLDLEELAALLLQRHEYAAAEGTLKRALEHTRELHNVLDEANVLWLLGRALSGQRQWEAAEMHLRTALDMYRHVHDVVGEGHALVNLGNMYLESEQLDKAEEQFKRALQLHKRVHDVLAEGNDLEALGNIELARGYLDEAEEYFVKALDLYGRLNNSDGEGYAVAGLGRACLARAQLDEAEQHLKDALVLHRERRDPGIYGDDLRALGDVYLACDQLAKAGDCFQEALELHSKAKCEVALAKDIASLVRLRAIRPALSTVQEVGQARQDQD